MRAASDSDPALFAGAVDIDIARRLTRLQTIELGLLAPLFFDALGADALGRRPFLTQIKRQPQAKKGGILGEDAAIKTREFDRAAESAIEILSLVTCSQSTFATDRRTIILFYIADAP